MGRFLFFGVIAGLALTWSGIQEFRLGAGAEQEPQYLSVAQLEAEGFGENAHVVIQDFALLSFSYVYNGRSQDDMDKVWVPMVPQGGEYFERLAASVDEEGRLPDDVPMPDDLKVIMVSSNASSDQALGQLGDRDTLQGMITNAIEELDSEEKKLLAESYPSADLDTVWIFEEGRRPAAFVKKAGLTGGGVVLLLLCVGAFVARARD